MGQYAEQAAKYLSKAAAEFGDYVDNAARHITEEDFGKVTALYQEAAALDVSASQLMGEEKVVEGECQVDNVCAKVTVGGVSLRGKMQFEIKLNGEWVTGHRDNSQYGQVFVSKNGSQTILSGGEQAKVTFPLHMDE